MQNKKIKKSPLPFQIHQSTSTTITKHPLHVVYLTMSNNNTTSPPSTPLPPPTAPTFDPFVNYSSNDYLTQEERDALYAQRLQEQEVQQQASMLNSFRSNNSNNINNTLNNNAQSQNGGNNIDEEMARKVEREVSDEMYARQLQDYERSRRPQVRPTTTTHDIDRIQRNQQSRDGSW
jgi:hypothetical protein